MQHIATGAPTVADIAVITDDWTHPLLDFEPPAGEPGVELMPGLWLEQLPDAEAEEAPESRNPALGAGFRSTATGIRTARGR